MSSEPPVEHEINAAEMHSLIDRDLAASNELAARIAELRQDVTEGKAQPSKKIALLERPNKDMTKELVLRIERIENIPAGDLEVVDKEMLQALNDRLAVCDLQAMRLAELRDLVFIANYFKESTYMDADVNERSESAGQEPEEQVTIGHASKLTVREFDGDTREPKCHTDDPEYGFDGSEEETLSENSEELMIDKSEWPLLYRVMNVDPNTMAADIQPLVHG